MQARQFIVQPYEGGAEVSFFEVPPCEFRAVFAYTGDKEFDDLSEFERNYYSGIAFMLLSARTRGLAQALEIPQKLTVKSVTEWAAKYAFTIVDDTEIPETAEKEQPEQAANPTE